MNQDDLVILIKAKDQGCERNETCAYNTASSFVGRMLHFVQHDKGHGKTRALR